MFLSTLHHYSDPPVTDAIPVIKLQLRRTNCVDLLFFIKKSMFLLDLHELRRMHYYEPSFLIVTFDKSRNLIVTCSVLSNFSSNK